MSLPRDTEETDNAIAAAVEALQAYTPKSATIAGGAAGNHTVTGIKTTDRLDEVLAFDTIGTIGASGATGSIVSNLTSEFTISADDTINNTGHTNTTGTTLLVRWTAK